MAIASAPQLETALVFTSGVWVQAACAMALANFLAAAEVVNLFLCDADLVDCESVIVMG